MVARRILIGTALGGALAGTLGLLAGGFQLLCRWPKPLSLLLIGDCGPIGTWITPPFLSNFLQHPWSLATPLALAALVLFSRRRTNSFAWYGALWLLLSALSISQIICFGATLGAICAAGCFEGPGLSLRLQPRLLPRFAGLLVAVALVATRLHAFFAPSPEIKVAHLAVHPFWTWQPWRNWIAWDLQTFGFILPLGIAGALLLEREALLLVILGVGGAMLSNGFSDINAILKLSTVAQMPLGILSAAVVARLWRRGYRPLALASALLCSIWSLCWVAAVGGNLPGLWYCKDMPAPPSGADLQVIAYLRHALSPGELLYRSHDAKKYTLYGGLPEPELDYEADVDGFTPDLIEGRQRLLSHPPTDVEAFLRQDFRWMILGPDDAQLELAAADWVRSGRAELRAEFPPLKVYYLKN